ncbi:MAG: hypothetical protein KF820_06190 [Candidatus Paracaedibacteraceae bacterium]|nr:hypothetical protein [Candidatus Paracaedibacteraceae bacterium]
MLQKLITSFFLISAVNAQDLSQDDRLVVNHESYLSLSKYVAPLEPHGETLNNKIIMRKIKSKQDITAEERNYLINIRSSSLIYPELWQPTYDYQLLMSWQDYENYRSHGINVFDDFLNGKVSSNILINNAFDKMNQNKPLSTEEVESIKAAGNFVQAYTQEACGTLELRVWNMWVSRKIWSQDA